MLYFLMMGVTVAYAEQADKKVINKDIQELHLALLKKLPQAANSTIKETPVKGVYEVLAGAQIFYMTKDARFVFNGDLIDLESRRNLSDEAKGSVRKEQVDALGEENMVVYKPEGETKHTITVFTDIHCPYCRRLHQEMDEYLASGVKVRYIFLPFKGKKSFDDSVSVWCAKNQNEAMDLAKSGGELESKTCDHPIEKHRELASVLSIRGTPAILYENGLLDPGYLPASKIVKKLENPDE